MRTLTFFLACIPFKATHHAKRIVNIGGFARLADKPELVAARTTYESLLQPHRPAEPLCGALEVHLMFSFPFPKSASKRAVAAGTLRKTTRPDCSNLAKTFEDALGRCGFFRDDAQVVVLRVSKEYSERPGITVQLWELEEKKGTERATPAALPLFPGKGITSERF